MTSKTNYIEKALNVFNATGKAICPDCGIGMVELDARDNGDDDYNVYHLLECPTCLIQIELDGHYDDPTDMDDDSGDEQ
jgi:hypothetical protein